MSSTLTIQINGRCAEIPVHGSGSILSALVSAGVTEVQAPCGGKGRCGKCLVTVTGPVLCLETGVLHEAAGERLPACRYAPMGNVTVAPEGEDAMRVVTDGAAKIGGAGEGLGLAVDIGTTTVAAFLYDLADGSLLAAKGARNAQRGFGADVISRITACAEGKLSILRDAIREQIVSMGTALCRESGREAETPRRVTAAGNTVMQHLAAGLDPTGIGKAPFTPQSLFGEHRAGGAILPAWPDADVYFCPCLSGYVGGDITAGLMAVDADRTEGLTLYMDIGTNGEMALGDKTGFLTCATAAGPAFEGAEIACGMDGAAGAIDRVRAINGDIDTHVIGERTARGLCGSGLVDAIAALLELSVIDETGRMADEDELPPALTGRLFRLSDGTKAFRLRDEVYLSARDVRQVQLAKAAIRAGAETLLETKGKKAGDISALVIAGGFGSFLDKQSALYIGMLPAVPPQRIRHAGNAAGAGAALALTEAGKARLRALAKRCDYLELSSSRSFMDRYIECMMFGSYEG